MASILDRYGIKEVADVTFYDINSDGSRGAPVLFLDTLKVSTIEQTAEQAEARGGKGNPPLIIWDYGKEINVTLEDALFSAKSMAIMFGDGKVGTSGTIVKTWSRVFTSLPADGDKFEYGGKTITYKNIKATAKFYSVDGGIVSNPSAENPAAFLTAEIPVEDMGVIEISSNSFPGTYYVTGDTYARSETTGKDEFFQFIIQKAKVQSENTITLEAEGDPSVFNMSLRVLRPADGKMMKLVKYNINEEEAVKVLTLSGDSTVAVGASIDLTAKLDGETTSETIVYASSNGEIASVDSNGKVTGKKAGSTTINAYLVDDAETRASFNITVTAAAG